MAAHSNRSPSPLSSRPFNSNMRNSETNPSIRRSFSGGTPLTKPSVLTNQRRFDPITPANSPSDFAGRRSVGKEGAASHLGDCDEKENDKKDNVMKASKMQSPAKGCKHFMSPTISAASKFTPSPRKKALVERNDAVRTSISLSDGKAMFFSAAANVAEDLEPKTETSSDLNLADDKKAVLESHPVPKPCKKVPVSDNHSTESMITDSDDLKLESCAMSKTAVLDNHPVSRPCKKVTFSDIHTYAQHSIESEIADSDSLRPESSSVSKGVPSPIAPLDADPSLPPYDPKTNYLSPRPRFIRYRPNRRVGMLLNKENGLLDDSLMAEIMSGSFSDSADEGSDESQTEDSKKEEEMEVGADADESQTEDSNKEEEMEVAAAASADMVIGVDEEIEADSHVSAPCSESLPVSTTPTSAISEEEFVQINEKKPRALSRLVCFSMILMFLIAGVSISVTHSSSFDGTFIKDFSLSDLSNLYQQSGVVSSARSSAVRLARHVNDVSASSVSLIFKLANELGTGRKQATTQFMNLSDLQDNPWNKEGHLPTIVPSLERVEEDEFEEELDDEMDYVFEEEEYVDEDVLDSGIDSYAEAEYDDYIEKDHDTQDDVVATAELESEVLLSQTELISSELNSEDRQSAAPQHQEIEPKAEVEVAMERLQAEKQQEAELEAQVERLETKKHQETEVEAEVEVAMVRLEAENHQEIELEAQDEKLETEKHQETEVEVSMERLVTEKSQADTISTDQTSFSKLMPEMESVPEMESAPAEDSSLARHAVLIPSIFSGLLAVAAAFVYHYKKRTLSSSNAVQVEPMLSKQTDYGYTIASTKQHIHQEKEFSRNWQQTEVTHAISSLGGGDESCCPSEMSSSIQRSGSYSRRRAAADEVQSSERKTRKISKRESLASSTEFSMGSPSTYSYGSFTTYEKISVKSNANVDEEIMTPVRRSSRIRSHQQVTST